MLTGYLSKVIFGEPGVPMDGQGCQGSVAVLVLAKSVFVYNRIIPCCLKKRRLTMSSDPSSASR